MDPNLTGIMDETEQREFVDIVSSAQGDSEVVRERVYKFLLGKLKKAQCLNEDGEVEMDLFTKAVKEQKFDLTMLVNFINGVLDEKDMQDESEQTNANTSGNKMSVKSKRGSSLPKYNLE